MTPKSFSEQSEVSQQFEQIWDDLHDPIKQEEKKILLQRQQRLDQARDNYCL